MFVSGGGDLGWRIYEFCLPAVMIGSMILIQWPYEGCGPCAGVEFTLTHAVEARAMLGKEKS